MLLPEGFNYAINNLWLKGYFLKILAKWIGQVGVDSKL